jgi:phosphoribosylamine--glycine ligase
MTRILVVGSGGREHAMGLALASGSPAPALHFAPGNPGTAELGKNHQVAADDVPGQVALARELATEVVLVGPEAPLVLGLADALAEAGVPCCGPSAGAARLEGSKRFCRELAVRAGVPGPEFRVVTGADEVEDAVRAFPTPPVVKADGLAGGKGVFLPDTHDAVMAQTRELLSGSLGDAGRVVVLEERLEGVEASLFFACHGEEAVPLPHARDHKRLGDGDTGPNTGGMGAISPNPAITPDLEDEVARTCVAPVLRELVAAGTPFVGFLFLGLMLTSEGPRLLEINVRLGDPETQAVLPRLEDGAFASLVQRTARGQLGGFAPEVRNGATCVVVLAAGGYPGKVHKGPQLMIGQGLRGEDRWLVQAGTVQHAHDLFVSGGRVAAVVARAEDPEEARSFAYDGVSKVSWDGMQYRRDIGATQEVTR